MSRGLEIPARLLLTLAAMAIAGCAAKPANTYADKWVAAPHPTTDEHRTRECRDIRAAIAQEQGAGRAAAGAAMANPMLIIAVQNESQRRIAMLETRASEIGCNAAFSTTPRPRSIDQCFADCKRLTAQDDAACFATCSSP